MLNIAAILAVHNGAATIGKVLSHLAANEIDVYVLDHGSTDSTPELLRTYRSKSIRVIKTTSFDGVFRLREQLAWKTQVLQSLTADWVIHVDADELDESPVVGETLRAFIDRMDTSGYDVIGCDEFVFIPLSPDEDHSRGDFTRTMRRYYHFAPPNRTLLRVAKRANIPDWLATGGHGAHSSIHRLAPERIRKRHYIGLSKSSLESQYLGRVFDRQELEDGWHCNRVATTPEFIRLPPEERTFSIDTDGWQTGRPEAFHLVFHQRSVYHRFPDPLPRCTQRPPMPFVIGVGRSGTTLLRLMLDAHPALSMSPETSWLGTLINQMWVDSADRSRIRAVLTAAPNWGDMGISEHELDGLLDRETGSDFVRGLYRLYGEREGATRFGDKTPHHSMIMLSIACVLAEAHFIHIIRDGRDVALSHRGLWFGPGHDTEAAARSWVWRIANARQQAQFLPHYMEVRYEELIANPESVLKRIGEFVDLPFHPDQLKYYEIAPSKLAEMGDIKWPDRLITAKMRGSLFERTRGPVDRSRIGRWRREMTAADLGKFEKIAGQMLSDLGYATSTVHDCHN